MHFILLEKLNNILKVSKYELKFFASVAENSFETSIKLYKFLQTHSKTVSDLKGRFKRVVLGSYNSI